MLNTKQKRSGFTVYAILTTLTLLSWAGFGAYERLRKIDLSSVPENILMPINPNIEVETLDLLEKKKFVNEEQIATFIPTTKNNRTSTDSAKLNQDNESSPSAQTQ